MLVFLNGQFVPEEQAVVSVFDRSFLYGDGLFETMLVRNGRPFRWTQHLQRLQQGAEFLKIKLPFSPETLRTFAGELVEKNQTPHCLLRLTLSRGVGLRGYSPKGADKPTLVMSLHPAPGAPNSDSARRGSGSLRAESEFGAPPPRWKLITATPRLPANEPLAQFKTCNKLSQVIARAEADAAGVDEALLLNTDGFVVEASTSNLFWIDDDTVCTPSLASGILAGVTRAVVLELCDALKIPSREAQIRRPELKQASGVFLSLSSWGVVEAESLDGVVLKRSTLIGKLQAEYEKLVGSETR